MRRYFLDVCLWPNIAVDREGEEYGSLDLAEDAARLQLAELLRQATNCQEVHASIVIRDIDRTQLSSVDVVLTTLWSIKRQT